MAMTLLSRPHAPVWVLGDARRSGVLALAGRLDLPFRQMDDGAPDDPSGPSIVLSSGAAGAWRAALLRTRFTCRLVHVGAGLVPLLPHDLVVRTAAVRRAESARVIPVLGPLHVVSPALLAAAKRRWAERLEHLPRPFVVLVIRRGGFRPLAPSGVARLGAACLAIARSAGGSVLASIDGGSGPEAARALQHALAPGLHVLYRTDEPGEDPTVGFMGSADAVLVGGASATALSEAASVDAPVYADPLDDFDRSGRRLLATLIAERRVRAFAGTLSPWGDRLPLDEAGDAAINVRRRLGI